MASGCKPKACAAVVGAGSVEGSFHRHEAREAAVDEKQSSLCVVGQKAVRWGDAAVMCLGGWWEGTLQRGIC